MKMKMKKMKKVFLLTCMLALLITSCKRNDIEPIIPNNEYDYQVSFYSETAADTDIPTLLGVAADGESTIRVRLIKSNDNTEIPKSIKLQLESIEYGTLSKTASDNGTHILVDETPDLKSIGAVKYYEYFYHAPEQFIGINDSIMNANISIFINDENVNEKISNRTIRVIRNPILFVHGFNSSASTYDNMINDIVNTQKYKKAALYAVDYAQTSFDSYITNVSVVPNGIVKLKLNLLKSGFIANKVNVVAHSMGGALTRNYIQSDDYRYDINKFIPINSTHSGTQIANLGISLANAYPTTILSILLTWGCLVDFQVDSQATKELNGSKLNKNIVPSHVLSSSYGDTKQVIALIREKQYLQAAIVYLIGNVTDKLYNEENDILVPLSGQNAGLNVKEITHYSGVWHCSILQLRESSNEIVKLFELKDSDRAYSQDGFNPPSLTYNPKFANNIKIDIYTESEVPVNSDKIIFSPKVNVKSTLILVVDTDTNKIVNTLYNESSSTTFNISNIGNIKKAELHFFANTDDNDDNTFVYSKKIVNK